MINKNSNTYKCLFVEFEKGRMLENFKGEKMALISVVDNARKADVFIYEVDREYQADLLVCVVEKERAKGDALWYMFDGEKKGFTSVFFVEKERDANIKVCFVDKTYQAKWKKSNKFVGRL